MFGPADSEYDHRGGEDRGGRPLGFLDSAAGGQEPAADIVALADYS